MLQKKIQLSFNGISPRDLADMAAVTVGHRAPSIAEDERRRADDMAWEAKFQAFRAQEEQQRKRKEEERRLHEEQLLCAREAAAQREARHADMQRHRAGIYGFDR